MGAESQTEVDAFIKMFDLKDFTTDEFQVLGGSHNTPAGLAWAIALIRRSISGRELLGPHRYWTICAAVSANISRSLTLIAPCLQYLHRRGGKQSAHVIHRAGFQSIGQVRAKGRPGHVLSARQGGLVQGRDRPLQQRTHVDMRGTKATSLPEVYFIQVQRRQVRYRLTVDRSVALCSIEGGDYTTS